MRIRFSRKFSKQYDKANTKIKSAFDARLKIFISNQFYPLLNNHQLTGKFAGFRSINVTGDWRAVFTEHVDENSERLIIFEVIGTHSQLYK